MHYENTPMQYTAIFHGCKNDNFQMKNVDNFLIFAQIIDRGYTLEPPQGGGSNEYPQSMFWSKISFFCSKHRLWVLVRIARSNETHNLCFGAKI